MATGDTPEALPLDGGGLGGGEAATSASLAESSPLPNPSPSRGGASGDRPVVLAAIAGAHGVTGEVRLKLFAESIDSLKAHRSLIAADRTLTLKSIRPGPHGAVARFAEITDRDAAETLRGTELYVSRSALPPLGDGEYYHTDIIGLPCVSPTQEEVGKVVAIENFGAGDILEIEKPDGKRAMVAFRDPGAHLDGERIVVDPEFLA